MKTMAKRNWVLLVLLALSALGATAAIAGELVDQGSPGNQGPWKITCVSGCTSNINVDGGLTVNASGVVTLDGGFTSTIDRACTSVVSKATQIANASISVPTVPAAGRNYDEICNSVENGPTVQLKCRGDGAAVAFGVLNAGDTLNVGDCHRYTISAATAVKCISNSSDAGVASEECVP